MKITSDNSQTEPVQDFLANIAEQAPLYRAIITSPSVSSGVDISFPNDAQLIDHVFGFFEALITSHFECDQQLGRVRNPKAVSVFLSPATFSFETDLDVVKHDLLVDRLLETLIDGYRPDGSMRFREDHPILDLAASVVSQERASKNHLRKNFIAHKIDQNYEIEMVEADEALVGIGKEHLSDAKEIVESQRVSALLSTDRLSKDELDIAEDRAEKGNVSDSMLWSIARTRLEVFYRTPISEELIARDKKGTLRRQVMLFTETLCAEPGRDSMLSEASLSEPLMKLRQTESWKAAFMRRALSETGLWDVELHEDIVLTSPDDFTSFVAFLKSFKAIYETQFGTELRNDLSQKPTSQLNTLLRQIGLKLVSFNPPIIKGGKKSYRYVLDQKTLEEMRQIVERRKLYTDPWAAIADCEDELPSSTTDAQF